MKNCNCGNTKLLLIAAGALAASAFVYLKVFRKKKLTFKDDPDVVYLVQLPRGKRIPSISPFPFKLETYLRIAKIPYENVFSSQFSEKGKTPWIHYRGNDISDSQFCIEYLNKQFNVDLNAHLTKEQRGAARAFLKMVEENLYWVLVCARWVFSSPTKAGFPSSMPWWVLWFIQRRMKQYAYAQGMARHSANEVFHIGALDYKAISDFLGEKKFLFGDKPCETDCGMFGLLAQVVFNQPDSPHYELIKKEFPNIERYCWTMRNEYWADWDQCLQKA